MRKRTLISLILTVAMILTASGIASAATWEYYFPITVSDNSSTTRIMYPVILEVGGQSLVDGGYATANGTNVRMRTTDDKSLMLSTDNIAFVVDSLPALGQVTYDLYTGYSPETDAFQIIVGDGGYATVADNTTIELGDNYTYTQSGWWDTDAGSDKNAVNKRFAFRTYVSATENVTGKAGVEGLDFVRVAGDWVSIPDSDDFSFTDGALNDEPFSLVAWVNLDDATGSSIISKSTAAKNEWAFATDGADKLEIRLLDPNGANVIGRETNAITGYEGQWIHIVCTYDDSEAHAGLDIYINGTIADTADITVGAYVGMTNNNAVVEIGSTGAGGASFLDGQLAEVKVYSVELTPAEIATDLAGGHKSTDLVAWYALEEGTGDPTDSSGNGHDATANLADWLPTASVTATSVSSGNHTVEVIQKACLTFDGNDDYVRANGVAGGGFFGGAFTMMVWAKLDAWGQNAAIVAGGDVAFASEYAHIGISAADNFVATTDKAGGGNDNTVTSADTYTNDDDWHFFAIVVDADSHINHFIVDTVDEGSDSTHINDLSNFGEFYIGQLPWNAPNVNPWEGKISEVWVFGRELEPAEIEEFRNGIYNDMTSLQAILFLDEGAGNPQDKSGNGNHGALINGTTWGAEILKMYVDSDVEDVEDGIGVPDNAIDWLFYQNNVSPYSDNTTISVNGTLQLWFEPNVMLTGTTIPDRESATPNDGTITWGSNDQIIITFGEMVSYEATTSVASVNVTGFVFPTVGIPTNWWGMNFDGTGLPFYPTFLDTSTKTGIPLQTLYLLLVFGAGIALATATIMLTRSVVVGAAFYTATMVYGANAGIVAWWIIYVYLIMVAGIIFLSSRQAMG